MIRTTLKQLAYSYYEGDGAGRHRVIMPQNGAVIAYCDSKEECLYVIGVAFSFGRLLELPGAVEPPGESQ